MWRYVVAALATMLLVAAGVLLSRSRAATDSPLPKAPQRATSAAASEDAALPDTVPQASARTREQKRFDRYDKDRDSAITREEYLASRRKAYARLDVNGDGTLSFEEWSAKAIAKFAGADHNGSGSLDSAEFATTALKRTPRAVPRCDCAKAAGDD